jgi:hypothetical protein
MAGSKHWSDPDWTPSPKIAALSDADLLVAARQRIKSLARDIAALVNVKAAGVEHGLYAHRWPIKSLGPVQLCDVLDEGVLILEHVRNGLSLDAALASVAQARWLRNREREHPPVTVECTRPVRSSTRS